MTLTKSKHMKKFGFIFAAIACIGIVAGCNKEKEEPTLSVAPTSITAKAEATTSSVKVSSNSGWTVKSSESWVTVSPAQGNGDATVSVTVAENTVASAREATLTFSCGTKSATVKVSQEAAVISGPYLAVTPSALTSNAAEAQLALAVTANTGWTAAGPDWVTLTPARGDGDASITVALAANTGEARSGEIVFTYDTDKTAKVSVSQEAAAVTPAGDWAGEWILTGHDETDNVDVAAKYYGSGAGTADKNLKYMIIVRNSDNKIVPKVETDDISNCRITISKVSAQSDTTFWSLQDCNGLYLESDGNGKDSENYLKGHDTLSENGWWTINDTDEGTVLVAPRALSRGNGRNIIRLNHNSGNYIFSSYAGTQQAVRLISWKEVYEALMFSAEIVSGSSLSAAGGEAVVEVSGNVEWTATVSGGASVSPASGKGNGTVTVTVPANTAATAAEYTVTVSTTADVEKKSYELKIAQDAAGTEKLTAITSAADFATFITRMSDYTAAETVTLEADITVAEPAENLSCNFDGKGHTITVDFKSTSDVGLFLNVASVKVSNLKVAGKIYSDNSIGAIALKTAENAVFENCESSVDVLCSSYGTAAQKLGGLVGTAATGARFVSCVNNGKIEYIMPNKSDKGRSSQLGGIVAQVNGKAELIKCVNNGQVKYYAKGSSRVGGMCAYVNDPEDILLDGCINKGYILVDVDKPSSGWQYVGGLTGYIGTNADAIPTAKVTYNGCSNEGKIEIIEEAGGSSRVGGIAGYAGCTNAKMTAAGFANGSQTYTYSDCVNSGEVTVTSASGNTQVGGIVGYVESSAKALFVRSSNRAALSGNGTAAIGGILGMNGGLETSFSDVIVTSASNIVSSEGGVVGLLAGSNAAFTTTPTGKVGAAKVKVGETETVVSAENYSTLLFGAALGEGVSTAGVTFGE